jgi:hypothetical protein
MEFTKEVTVEIDIDADDIVSAFYGNWDELLCAMDISDIISYLVDNLETDVLLDRLDNEVIIKYLVEESGGATEMLDAIPHDVTVDYVVHNTDNAKLLREVHDDLILKYVTQNISIGHIRQAFEKGNLDVMYKDKKVEKPVEDVLREVPDSLILKYVTQSIPLPHIKRAFGEVGCEIVDKDEKPTLLSLLKSSALTPHSHRLLLTSEEKTWLFANLESADLINAIFARGLTLSLMEEFIKRSVTLGTDQRLAALQQEENNNE